MPSIVILNPKKQSGKKKKKPSQSKKGPKPMAAKKKKPGPKKGKKRGKRGNPKKGVRYVKQTIGGINPLGAIQNTLPMLLGALGAKFAAKKFAAGGGEASNWTWKNYLLALLGGAVVAFGAQAIFRKKKIGQRAFEGALLLVSYKLFCNDIATQNTTLESMFGATAPAFDPYAGVGQIGSPGDIYETDKDEYIMGADNAWRDINDNSRLPGGVGDVQVPNDPRFSGLGDIEVPAMNRFSGAPTPGQTAQMFEADGM